ncbi:MAG: nitrate/nitrite transporter [Clostridiaceae bacterium]
MRLTKKQYMCVFFATLSLLVWNLPYLSATFYEQFLSAYNLTNTQAGFLLTMFGLTAVPGYLFGGILADKFSAKKLLILSCISTAILGFIASLTSSYTTLIIIYLGFGVTVPFINWSAFLKLVRSQGSLDQQGKLFGFFELVYAAMGAAVSYGLLAALGIIMKTTGFKIVMSIYGILLLFISALIWFYVKDADKSDTVNEFNLKMVGHVLKQPVTWLNGFIVMGMFIIISGSSYLNPYLTQVFGMATTIGVGFTIFNRSIARIIFTPIGGAMIDKWGKSSKVLIICASGVIITILALMLIPKNTSYGMIAVIIGLLFLIAMSSGRAGMYTPVPEANTPIAITGTTMGIVSAIGYSTDLWLWTLCGGWIDKYGTGGYQYIFGLFIAAMVLVIVSAIIFQLYLNKNKANYQEVLENNQL